MSELISTIELAELVGVDRRTISNWTKQGLISKHGLTTKYDKAATLEAIKAFRGIDDEGSQRTNWKEEKQKYDALKAKAEYEASIKALVDREVVETLLYEIGAYLREALLNIPASEARILISLENADEIEKHLDRVVRGIIAEVERKFNEID